MLYTSWLRRQRQTCGGQSNVSFSFFSIGAKSITRFSNFLRKFLSDLWPSSFFEPIQVFGLTVLSLEIDKFCRTLENVNGFDADRRRLKLCARLRSCRCCCPEKPTTTDNRYLLQQHKSNCEQKVTDPPPPTALDNHEEKESLFAREKRGGITQRMACPTLAIFKNIRYFSVC